MPPKRRRIKWDVVALHAAVIGGLLAISLIMWWRVWVTGHPTSTISCLCGDESGTLEILDWTPWALAHGHNPFFSNAIFAGQGGANMLTNTTWIVGSLLFSPVTWLFGPIATFNVVVTLAPVASGWCCFLACRQFSRFVPGQIVAAVLYGFSPIIVTLEPVGHLAQIWLIYPPLAFLILYDLFVTQRCSPLFLSVSLALLTVVQFFISTEVLTISLVAGGIGMIVAAILAPRQQMGSISPHPAGVNNSSGNCRGVSCVSHLVCARWSPPCRGSHVSIDVEFRTSYLRSGLHWPVRPPTQPLARDHWLLGKWGARLCLHWRSHAGISCSLDLCVVQRPAGVGLGCRRSIVVVVLIGYRQCLDALATFRTCTPGVPGRPRTILRRHRVRRSAAARPFS